MPLNLDDPRVRKTRRGLQEALVRLILRGGYDVITIQDIATEAETARITFYRHYRDKEELLTDCLNTLYEDLASKTARLSLEGFISGYSPIQAIYKHIEEHESMYQVLFKSRGTQTVIERMRHHIATLIKAQMQRSGRTPQADIPPDIIAYHLASAQLGLAMWWLDHGKPYPPDYMARISLWLSMSGLIETMGAGGLKLPIPTIQDK